MTPASRSTGFRARSIPRTPRTHGRFRSWLAACIVPWASGCLYLDPIWRPVENNAPVLLEPQATDNLLRFEHDSERITVIASDPDGDNLSFAWDYPPFLDAQELVTPSGSVTFGRLDLFWHPDIDGTQIRLIVVDDNRTPRSVTATWLVEDL